MCDALACSSSSVGITYTYALDLMHCAPFSSHHQDVMQWRTLLLGSSIEIASLCGALKQSYPGVTNVCESLRHSSPGIAALRDASMHYYLV